MENHSVKNGIVAGLLVSVASLVAYFIGPRVFMGPIVQYGLLIVYIFFMYQSAQAEKESLGGYMTWGQALKPTFLTYAIGSAIAIIFTYVMYNFVDTTLIETQREVAMEAMEGMSGLLGEEGVEAALEALEEQEFAFTIPQATLGWAMGLIFGFIISAILSAIVKKDPPEMV